MGEARTLPAHFTRDIIMKAPTAPDISVGNSLRQCLELIATFPLFAAYVYHSYNHYKKGGSMYIHMPDPKLSAAENLLSLLRPDRQYTPLEAKVLDTALILHMEHGGANLKFISVMGDIREHVNKEAFDRTGLIYGMGHAVYTLSDPREKILKEYVKQPARTQCRLLQRRSLLHARSSAVVLHRDFRHCPNRRPDGSSFGRVVHFK